MGGPKHSLKRDGAAPLLHPKRPTIKLVQPQTHKHVKTRNADNHRTHTSNTTLEGKFGYRHCQHVEDCTGTRALQGRAPTHFDRVQAVQGARRPPPHDVEATQHSAAATSVLATSHAPVTNDQAGTLGWPAQGTCRQGGAASKLQLHSMRALATTLTSQDKPRQAQAKRVTEQVHVPHSSQKQALETLGLL